MDLENSSQFISDKYDKHAGTEKKHSEKLQALRSENYLLWRAIDKSKKITRKRKMKYRSSKPGQCKKKHIRGYNIHFKHRKNIAKIQSFGVALAYMTKYEQCIKNIVL